MAYQSVGSGLGLKFSQAVLSRIGVYKEKYFINFVSVKDLGSKFYFYIQNLDQFDNNLPHDNGKHIPDPTYLGSQHQHTNSLYRDISPIGSYHPNPTHHPNPTRTFLADASSIRPSNLENSIMEGIISKKRKMLTNKSSRKVTRNFTVIPGERDSIFKLDPKKQQESKTEIQVPKPLRIDGRPMKYESREIFIPNEQQSLSKSQSSMNTSNQPRFINHLQRSLSQSPIQIGIPRKSSMRSQVIQIKVKEEDDSVNSIIFGQKLGQRMLVSLS